MLVVVFQKSIRSHNVHIEDLVSHNGTSTIVPLQTPYAHGTSSGDYGSPFAIAMRAAMNIGPEFGRAPFFYEIADKCADTLMLLKLGGINLRAMPVNQEVWREALAVAEIILYHEVRFNGAWFHENDVLKGKLLADGFDPITISRRCDQVAKLHGSDADRWKLSSRVTNAAYVLRQVLEGL